MKQVELTVLLESIDEFLAKATQYLESFRNDSRDPRITESFRLVRESRKRYQELRKILEIGNVGPVESTPGCPYCAHKYPWFGIIPPDCPVCRPVSGRYETTTGDSTTLDPYWSEE